MSQATQSHTRWLGHSEELWQNMVHWRRKWQPIPVFLPQESPEQYEKAKRYDTGKQALQVGRFNMLPAKTEGRLLTVMRWLDSITNSISKLWLIVENRRAWCAALHGLQRVATQQLNNNKIRLLQHCKGETIIHTPCLQHTHTHTHAEFSRWRRQTLARQHAQVAHLISSRAGILNRSDATCEL